MVKMKTSPYLILIFLKILVLTVVFGQLSRHHQQFLNRRNRLFSQRREHRKLNSASQSASRTRKLNFPSRIKSSGSRQPITPRLPHARLSFRNDLSTSAARSLASGGGRKLLKRPRGHGPPRGPGPLPPSHLRGGGGGGGGRDSNEVFFVKLEDGFFGCQVCSNIFATAKKFKFKIPPFKIPQ